MTMGRHPTEASFLRDVAGHEMTVRLDSGLYRSIRFQRPGTWNMAFDIATWPGFLCFSGDMGCYVFSRVPDMLEFFRGKPEGPLRIDLGYWAEKVQAQDRCCGVEEYSPEKFRERVDWWLTSGGDEGPPQDLRDAVADEVLSRADDGEHEAMRAAMEFEHEGFRFEDFWEARVRDYTHRFVWCCYALAWAVRKYDAETVAVAGEAS
jgi:hypothetical protein